MGWSVWLRMERPDNDQDELDLSATEADHELCKLAQDYLEGVSRRLAIVQDAKARKPEPHWLTREELDALLPDSPSRSRYRSRMDKARKVWMQARKAFYDARDSAPERECPVCGRLLTQNCFALTQRGRKERLCRDCKLDRYRQWMRNRQNQPREVEA